MEDVLAKLSRVTHCNILQRSATKCNTLQHPEASGDGGCNGETEQSDTLQHIAKRCNITQHIATPCNTRERREWGNVLAKLSRVTLDNTLQNAATNCNTPQYPATPRSVGRWKMC